MAKSIAEQLAQKTFQELAETEKPQSRTRVWKSSNGYIYLIPWANASLLRLLVRVFTKTLPKSEYRLKAQLDDAARSVVANIEEGFARPTTSEYLTFLGYSQASLKEVKGDIQRSKQDTFLVSKPGSSLVSIGIDLKDWHAWLKQSVISKQDSTTGDYRKLKDITGRDLSYEIFIELINKTDWHLQRLVESLEHKLQKEAKGYQIEQARIKSKLPVK